MLESDPKPTPPLVTVGELLDALATYPRELIVSTGENRSGGGLLYAFAEGSEPFEFYDLWEGHPWDRPHHKPRNDAEKSGTE
jgi:hypothetical protein